MDMCKADQYLINSNIFFLKNIFMIQGSELTLLKS